MPKMTEVELIGRLQELRIRDGSDADEEKQAKFWDLIGQHTPTILRMASESVAMRRALINEHATGHRLMGEFCPVCEMSPK